LFLQVWTQAAQEWQQQAGSDDAAAATTTTTVHATTILFLSIEQLPTGANSIKLFFFFTKTVALIS